jgi:tRNA pseudouridine38-40 synthase
MEMQCDKPFLSDQNIEFAVIRVKGQSFMLHQIRKMVGLAIAIIRGHTEPATITKALTAERIDIPMAPGLGLVLDKIHYEKYNHRYGSDGMHESLEVATEVQEELNEYFLKHIFKTILDAEIETKSMSTWMETLGRHSYDVREADKNKEESGNVSESSKNSDD